MTTFLIECYILNVAFITSSILFIKEMLELFGKAIGFEAFLWASGIWFIAMLVCWYNWPV